MINAFTRALLIRNSMKVLGVATIAAALVLVTGVFSGPTTPVQAQTPELPQECLQLNGADWDVCIVKDTDPATTGVDFGFEWDWDGGDDDGGTFPLGDGEGRLISANGPGILVVTEDEIPNGWQLVDIECFFITGDATWNHVVSIEDGSVTFNFEQGLGDFLCYFYNEEDDDGPGFVPTPDRRGNPPNIAGAFGGIAGGTPQGTPTPVPAPTVVAPVIAPPNTGSAGLK